MIDNLVLITRSIEIYQKVMFMLFLLWKDLSLENLLKRETFLRHGGSFIIPMFLNCYQTQV